MKLVPKIAASLLVLGLTAFLAGWSTYAAFSGTTSNASNSLEVGSVYITDNDAGSAVVSLVDAGAGDSSSGCIALTYAGTLDAGLRLFAETSGALAPYLNVTVTRGVDAAPAFPSCTGFVADLTNYSGAGAGVIYSGTLSDFPATYAAGIQDPALLGGDETWSTGEVHSYRIEVSLSNDPAALGKSASAEFVWEARNL